MPSPVNTLVGDILVIVGTCKPTFPALIFLRVELLASKINKTSSLAALAES